MVARSKPYTGIIIEVPAQLQKLQPQFQTSQWFTAFTKEDSKANQSKETAIVG